MIDSEWKDNVSTVIAALVDQVETQRKVCVKSPFYGKVSDEFYVSNNGEIMKLVTDEAGDRYFSVLE